MEDEWQDTHSNDDYHEGWLPEELPLEEDWCPQDTDEQGALLPF